MPKHTHDDTLREKFRPDSDAALDREIDQALAGISLDELLADKPTNKSVDSAKGLRRGRVMSIDPKDDAVFVDFGGKSQGMAALSQFEKEPTIGQEMDFHVERYDPAEGLLILNKKGAAASHVTWENLEVGQIIEGVVTGVNKGGLELQVKGMRAFMPAGQVDLFFQPDLNVHMNQKLTAEVTAFDAHAKNLVLSRRNVLEREREEAKQKLMNEIAEGQIRRGTVRSIMDYGAFIDLGGLDGLLHVSELTHRRGVKVADFVKVGDLVDVKIVKIDKATGKLGLSLKQMMADPWIGAEAKYSAGTPVTGRVSRVENFGAFIEVEEGVEGLLPVSEISYQRIRHPSEIVKEGDTLRLVVLSIDPLAKKMSFSLKQAGPDPWKTVAERYATDMTVDGTVTRVVDFGAFVELEPGLEGLVHISELANNRVKSAGDVVKAGQSVRVRVMDIDAEGRRISLSLKQAIPVAAATAASPIVAQNKPKRPQLRGGLDY
jgi:small subunit ribosomal protein S1